MIHIPKGSMCASCAKFYTHNCKSLPFHTMPVIKKCPDGVVTVKCVEFVRIGVV